LFGQDAGGGLIRKQAYDNNTIQTTTDYIDGFVYLTVTTGTPILSYFAMPEGRVRYTGSALKPEYIINDQQGNAWISFEESATPGVPVVRQENSYYPSGQIMPNSPVGFPSGNTDNKHLYNGGSEWQNDFSNLPDYYQTFFRNYDAALMQFVAVDPVAESVESMSTYQYANNNPVMNNDPMGNFFTPTLPAQYTAFGSDIHSTAQFWQSYGSAWNGGTDDSGVLGFIFSHPGGGSGNGDGIDDGRSDPTSLSATKNMEYFDFINQAKSGNSDAVEAYAAHYGQTVDIFVSNKGDVAVTAGGKHSWIDTQNEDGTWHYRELANQGGQSITGMFQNVISKAKIGETLTGDDLENKYGLSSSGASFVKSITKISNRSLQINWNLSWSNRLKLKLGNVVLKDGVEKFTSYGHFWFMSGTALGIEYNGNVYYNNILLFRTFLMIPDVTPKYQFNLP